MRPKPDSRERRVHTSAAPPPVAIRSMLDVFSVPERRAVLHGLEQADGPMELADLADQVRVWCADDPRTDARSFEEYLYDHHVHEMVRFGVLDYDRDRRTVAVADGVSVTVRPPPEGR